MSSADAPVLLVHGLATSASRTWAETGWLDLLADAGRVTFAPDLPGHGGAPGLDDWNSLEDHFDSIVPPGPLDAVGFSLGARLLLVLACRRPDRFGRLVLAGVGANLFGPRQNLDDVDDLSAEVSAAAPSDEMSGLARHFRQLAEQSGTDPTAVAAILERRHETLPDDALAAITADTLVVLGTEDFAGPPGPLVDRLTKVRLVELPGVDHFATPKSMGFMTAGLSHLGAG